MISVTIDSPNPDIGPQWDDLVGRANSNVFMNPAALTAASELNFARIQVLQAWQENGGGRKLVGVWALQSRRPVPFWPMLLQALPYNYAFLSSPVVDSACVDEVIATFFTAIEKSPSLPRVLSLQSLDAECPSCAVRSTQSSGVSGYGDKPRFCKQQSASPTRTGSARLGIAALTGDGPVMAW